MNNLEKNTVKLRTEQALLDQILQTFNIELIRNDIENEIMATIDDICLKLQEERSKFCQQVSTYLTRDCIYGDHWSKAQDYIKLAIVVACHYERSVLVLPPNKKVLDFLLPKLREKFGISITLIEQSEVRKVENRPDAEITPYFFKKNWVFYKITMEV